MKFIYVKGINSSETENKRAQKILQTNGLEVKPLGLSYFDLLRYKNSDLKKELSEKMQYIFPDDELLYLICHSEGCNLGAIMASIDDRIQKLVLVSPMIKAPSHKEKLDTKMLAHEHGQFGEVFPIDESPLSMSKVKARRLFVKSKELARKELESLKQDVLLLYSQGDDTISSQYLKALAERDNFKLLGVYSCHHNPIISKPRICTETIKRFCKIKDEVHNFKL